MSATIWLITEDETDYRIVKRFIEVLRIVVRVRWLKTDAKPGSLSRLVDQLERLIETAQQQKAPHDCIAVLHDADELVQPDRTKYNQIKAICERYNVKRIVAQDEIESWLLSDEGVCHWLGIKPTNNDSVQRPSTELNSLMKKNKNLKYQGRDRDRVLGQLNGNNHSQSFQQARKILYDAPCIKG